MMIADISTNYLHAFQNRDIDALAAFLSDSVELRDWEVYAKGKQNVLEANMRIFDSFTSIELDITNLIVMENQAAVEFTLFLRNNDNQIKLLVTDILEFNSDGEITTVRAYRGN